MNPLDDLNTFHKRSCYLLNSICIQSNFNNFVFNFCWGFMLFLFSAAGRFQNGRPSCLCCYHKIRAIALLSVQSVIERRIFLFIPVDIFPFTFRGDKQNLGPCQLCSDMEVLLFPDPVPWSTVLRCPKWESYFKNWKKYCSIHSRLWQCALINLETKAMSLQDCAMVTNLLGWPCLGWHCCLVTTHWSSRITGYTWALGCLWHCCTAPCYSQGLVCGVGIQNRIVLLLWTELMGGQLLIYPLPEAVTMTVEVIFHCKWCVWPSFVPFEVTVLVSERPLYLCAF